MPFGSTSLAARVRATPKRYALRTSDTLRLPRSIWASSLTAKGRPTILTVARENRPMPTPAGVPDGKNAATCVASQTK